MTLLVTYLAVIFGCGLVAWLIRLPPLIGFMAAGFVLNAMGVREVDELTLMADIGVTLMLFAIGLRLDLRSLTNRAVWLAAGGHMLAMTLIGTGFLFALSLLGAFGPESLGVFATIALVLSFSSTIFVVKILQDRGDEHALYGAMCIGVLIMQDIAAVAVISVSRGEAPRIYSLGLILLVPALALVTRNWHRLGHGDMGALFGVSMAIIPGYALFEWLGLSGSLGALVMGLTLAPTPGSDQLSTMLFTLKELLLVGFFVSVGFHGLPTLSEVGVGLLLLLLLPVQATMYWLIIWLIGMRNRTSLLAALLLSNYSEFALIVAAMGVTDGWLAPHWLPAMVVALSVGFLISALVNPVGISRISRIAMLLPVRPPDRIHPDDQPIHIGSANAIVIGMGRVGSMTYRQLVNEHGYEALGVEHDPYRVKVLQKEGFNVVEGDATDVDFWLRVIAEQRVELIVLAMPSEHANIEALKQLRVLGYGHATLAAIALYREDIEELENLGIDTVVHLYEGAGEAIADRAVLAAKKAKEARD